MKSIRALRALRELPDLELTSLAQQGDLEAFETLMRRNNRTLFRVARSILKDDDEAEDAVQEAYLLAYQGLAKFNGAAKIGTWMTRITINECLQRLRRRKRDAEVRHGDNVLDINANLDAGNISSDCRSDPEAEAMRLQTRELLERKIDALPAAFRTVFMLRGLEEMSVEETAQCLGLNETTVRTRFLRAKGMLRESFAQEIDSVFEDTFAFAGTRCDRIVSVVLERIRQLSSKFGPLHI